MSVSVSAAEEDKEEYHSANSLSAVSLINTMALNAANAANVIGNAEEVDESQMPAFEMSQGQRSFNMGNEHMYGEDEVNRTQKSVPSGVRGGGVRGTVKTRKEKKQNVMMREAE